MASGCRRPLQKDLGPPEINGLSSKGRPNSSHSTAAEATAALRGAGAICEYRQN